MSLATPESIQKLQAALHDKAKKLPDFRFYALYDKVYRRDVLSYAYACCKTNGGVAGVDNQTFEDIEAYGAERWLDELIFTAVYHLQSTSSGTSVTDSTANGNSGIAGNNGIAPPTEGTGVFGTGAGSFNGSQGIYLPSFAISTFTVSAWIFPTVSGNTGAFLAGPIGAMEARQRGDNTLDLVDEDVVDMGASSSLLTMNAWNHVAISYDGATASFFINGAPSGTNSISQSFGSGNYYIGEAQSGEDFTGNIDELKLSASVRSPDWIATEYNNPR